MKHLVYTIVLGLLYVSYDSDNIKEEEQPNILLIMVDDMGYTDIQPYGCEKEIIKRKWFQIHMAPRVGTF